MFNYSWHFSVTHALPWQIPCVWSQWMAFLILQLQKDHVFLKLNLLQVFYCSWGKPFLQKWTSESAVVPEKDWMWLVTWFKFMLALTKHIHIFYFFPFYEYFTLLCFLSYQYVSSFPNVLPLSPSSSHYSSHQQTRFWFNSVVVDSSPKHLRNYQVNGAKGLWKDLLLGSFVFNKQIQ